MRYSALIDASTLYRPHDGNFGIVSEPYIYVIKGINGPLTSALVPPTDAMGSAGYHGAMTFFLGPHKKAVARRADGTVLFEAVYREVIDQNALAGGFSFESDEPIEQKVLYPQSDPRDPKYLYPRSLRNARYDLVNKLRMPTSNPALSKKLGPAGGEMLPLWMMSEQTAGDASSVLGFIPAITVAYALPGWGDEIVKRLNSDISLPPVGKPISFDRYYLFEEIQAAPTTFDDNTTTFDGGIFTPSYATFDG